MKSKGAKGAKGAKRGGKRGKKTSMYRSVPDKASCSVTRTLAGSNANAIYAINTVQLIDYQRAAGIAQYYQRFRIVGITLTFKPVYDTYALPAVAGYAKPNLYYVIDKNASLPNNITLEGLKQAGARVRALDEKPVSIRWKPAVLEENLAGGLGNAGFAAPSGYKTSPWLSTNELANNPGLWQPNETNHLGVKFYIEQAGNGGQQVATAFPTEMTVEFEFIKPMIGNLVSTTPAMGLQYAVLDQSPDGVEGGSDGITVPIVQ